MTQCYEEFVFKEDRRKESKVNEIQKHLHKQFEETYRQGCYEVLIYRILGKTLGDLLIRIEEKG